MKQNRLFAAAAARTTKDADIVAELNNIVCEISRTFHPVVWEQQRK